MRRPHRLLADPQAERLLINRDEQMTTTSTRPPTRSRPLQPVLDQFGVVVAPGRLHRERFHNLRCTRRQRIGEVVPDTTA